MIRFAVTAFVVLSGLAGAHAQTLTPDEARAVAKEAYIFGFPLLDNYRVQYSYFVRDYTLRPERVTGQRP